MPTMLDSPITTADQLFALEEPGFRHELVRGELLRMSGPNVWHGAIVMRVGGRLEAHATKHELGTALGETTFVLARDPDTVRIADAAFLRAGRMPAEDEPGQILGAPDLAIEVVSPSNTYVDLHRKALQWLEHGARLVWIVEPRSRTVSIHRPDHSGRVLTIADTLDGEDVVPGFRMPVAEVFPARI